MTLPVSRWERAARSPVHTLKIAEPVDVSKPAEYRNYSLRCTLYSRGFLCYPLPVLPTPSPPCFSPIFVLSLLRPFLGGLPTLHVASLWTSPDLSLPCISPTQLRHSHLYALILVHTDRAGYLRGKGLYFWQRLPPRNAPAISASTFVPAFPRAYSFASPKPPPWFPPSWLLLRRTNGPQDFVLLARWTVFQTQLAVWGSCTV